MRTPDGPRRKRSPKASRPPAGTPTRPPARPDAPEPKNARSSASRPSASRRPAHDARRADLDDSALRLETSRGTGPSAVEHDRAVYVLSRDALRQIDRLCAEHYGLPTLALMENAAAQLAGCALDIISRDALRAALIVCGPGHNGGDGLALARHLHNAGVPIGVLLARPPQRCTGDSAVHVGVARRMGIRLGVADAQDAPGSLEALVADLPEPLLLVDALLGTGPTEAIEAGTIYAELIATINAVRSVHDDWRTLSVDLPSGMHADTGRGLAPEPHACVRADATTSFAGLKLGFTHAPAQEALGEVMVADIGCPRELVRRLGRPLAGVELPPPTGASTSPVRVVRRGPRRSR